MSRESLVLRRVVRRDGANPFSTSLGRVQTSLASSSASSPSRARFSSRPITSASKPPLCSTRRRSVRPSCPSLDELSLTRLLLSFFSQMVIPIKDIIALQPQKAFRFGHHGLAVVIKGHEELFLEFSSAERRDACKSLLEQQMDELRFKAQHGPQPVTDQQQEALHLQDLDTMGFSSPQRQNRRSRHEMHHSSGQHSRSSPSSGYGSDHLPPVMFTSMESTFLDFKPKEPMHITCLTIGSRGDVQPCEFAFVLVAGRVPFELISL